MAAIQHDDQTFAAVAEIAHIEYEEGKQHAQTIDFEASSTSEKKVDVERSPSLYSSRDDVLEEPDYVHAGLEFPTEDEIHTLRRVPDAVPWNAYLIAIVEIAERFSVRYSSQRYYTNFIQQPMPEGSRTGAGGAEGQAGALGLGQRMSTGLTTFYMFWCYITPFAGAYVADAHLGRFRTICIAVVVALIGHILLIVAAIPGIIEHKSAVGAFVAAIIVMGFGTGLFKPNISPLIAEQYKKTKLFVVTNKSGERVIVDPNLTVSRIFMYFYLFINIGALLGQIGMTYSEKYVGFWLAFTLPTLVFLLSPLVLWAGRNRYQRSKPTGSVLLTAVRVWRLASRGRWSWNPIRTFKNFNAPGFWDQAKPSRQLGESKPKWMTFDDNWVDELQRGLKACGVFLWYPLYWVTYNQINNNLISQAATMTTRGIPNDILSNLDPFALIILIPAFDLLLYPFLRRMHIQFTALKKITLGFFTGAAAMVWAAVVQHYIYKTNPCGYMASTCEDQVSPLSVWIQSGAYILIAISEILASVTGIEYAFTKAPKNMRSLVTSYFLFMSAVASAIGEAFVSLSSDPLLVWNYGVMGVLAAASGAVFWFSTRDLDRQEDRLNYMKEGHFDDEKH
ncbi:POT family-domain-containing protein [Cyathus striatus]|nr:POT family-domain-containing protein [Cyathus striatus]